MFRTTGRPAPVDRPRRSLKRLLGVAAAATCALALTSSSAHAFDTQAHADMTRDALTAEGFTPSAANVGVVDNWFVDYYTNPGKNPYSGHAGFWIGLTRLGLSREEWPFFLVDASQRLHFDASRRTPEMPDLSTTAGVDQEWQRLMHLTRRIIRIAGNKNDPAAVMAVLGTSLHSVQDFYSHSNWVEDPSPEPGRGGPGISRLGYGDLPTWFDVPPTVREKLVGDRAVYTGVQGIPRGHGHWRSNENGSLHDGLNKDHNGRPKYQEAYLTAYFATRQWIRGVRTWLGNEPLWAQAMTIPNSRALEEDVQASEEVSKYSGHWQGGGEPCLPGTCGERNGKAGAIVSLRNALESFHDDPPSRFRRAVNEYLPEYRLYPKDVPRIADLPSSRTDQLSTRFVKLEVADYWGINLTDPVGGGDIYARARINGQPFTSTVINGEDKFHFPRPYAPFSWIRSLPGPLRASTPVTSMTVRIETGDKRFAGTDDDVFLRINGRQRFSLEKAAYNDFERGDDDTYSVPIGEATRDGLTIGDLHQVTIEKSRDGAGGGWFLGGVTLTVNGREVVRERRVNRWLENSRRAWNAPRFARDQRLTDDTIPVWLELKEDDFGPDDTGDLNELDRHTSLPISYRFGTSVQGVGLGGHKLRGRLSLDNGDRARATWRLTPLVIRNAPPLPAASTTTNPEPRPDPTTQPTPGGPDLVITEMTGGVVTVKNQGPVATGAFTVRVTDTNGMVRGTMRIDDGLAAGAETTVPYSSPSCEVRYRAVADSESEVGESDETNNTKEFFFSVC